MKLVFLPRHGLKHTIPPHKINYRANIYALKKYGVTDIISVSAVGSLKNIHKPGDFILPNQFVDRTFNRVTTFIDEDCNTEINPLSILNQRGTVRSAIKIENIIIGKKIKNLIK